MIVGQFCDSYPPTLDGVARVTFAYCKTLTKMGHRAYYIAPKNSDAPDYPDLETIFSPGLKIPTEQWHVGLPALGVKYRKNLREIPFDIVHAQSPFIAGGEAARIAKKLNIPLVATFHSKYYDDFLQRTHSEKLSKFLLKFVVEFYEKCDAVWTVNKGTAEVLRGYGFLGEIKIMENGTNVEEVSEGELEKAKRRIGKKEGELTLLFVGRHNKQKNLKGIIETCRELEKRGEKYRLVTAGTGPDFEKTVKYAEKLGVEENCQFLGQIDDREELMALYKAADLLVFPSIYDSAPMVLREAAAQGTPGVVIKGTCSAEDFRDGENILIAESIEADKIAEKIIEYKNDLEKIGKEARKTIPTPWSEIMKKVEREYARLIEEKQRKIAEAQD